MGQRLREVAQERRCRRIDLLGVQTDVVLERDQLVQQIDRFSPPAGEAKDLGGQTEAKGYAAISRSLVENGTPGPVAVSSPGFAWSDAGVGAGITVAAAMLALLGTTGVVSTRRRRTSVA